MILSEILTLDNCIVPLSAADKESALAEMVDRLQTNGLITDGEAVLKAVLEREEQGSTGLGKGIAVPHARLSTTGEVRSVLGISSDGIDFDSLDGQPAHLFFLILIPADKAGIHLQVLGDVASLAGREDRLQKLIGSQSAEEALELLRSET